MILILERNLSAERRARLRALLEGTGRRFRLDFEAGVAEVAEGPQPAPDLYDRARLWPGVKGVEDLPEPYPRVRRAGAGVRVERAEGPPLEIGEWTFTWIAGPCAVENNQDLAAVADACARAGASILRAGAFKPRTSPYSYQGAGAAALPRLAAAAQAHGLALVTEVMDPRDVGTVAEYAGLLQIGSRSMQNFPLLREAGESGRPVLLKRGPAATLEEFLGAAEYLLEAGAPGVVLCERGVKSFDPSRRNLLDLSIVPALAERTRLPVVVDPSHACGRRELVPSMAKAAVAAGAAGVMVEVHPAPERARSDPRQALRPDDLPKLGRELRRLAAAEGRTWNEPRPAVAPAAKDRVLEPGKGTA